MMSVVFSPLQKTIEITLKHFENSPQPKVTKRELKQLFNFATSGTHFIFNGRFYDQTDAVSIGSLLGPALANLFMGYYEKNGLQEFDKGKILMYKRYVDDIFVCLEMKRRQKISLNFLTVNIKI